MRAPAPLAALFSLLIAPAALAQVKTDLGAAATAGPSGAAGSAAAGSSAVSVLPSAVPVAATLSAAPPASLAPAASPSALALPAVPDGAGNAAAPAHAPPGPPVEFAAALVRLGVSRGLADRLDAFMTARHPGDQNRVYHGLGHSREVAGFAARLVEGADLPPDRKVLLIVAAALHDVDPERVPDTPARVSATLKRLDEDPEARALLADFGGRHSFTPAQVKALILATDFSLDPAEMTAKQELFTKSAALAFGDDFGLVWGRRLSFVDQASTYLDSVETARRRVEGLAREIRTQLGAIGKGPGPADAQMLAGSYKFLSALHGNPDFALLPADLQGNFDRVLAYFEARQTPQAWESEAAPAQRFAASK